MEGQASLKPLSYLLSWAFCVGIRKRILVFLGDGVEILTIQALYTSYNRVHKVFTYQVYYLATLSKSRLQACYLNNRCTTPYLVFSVHYINLQRPLLPLLSML